jgi:hypothetical protein
MASLTVKGVRDWAREANRYSKYEQEEKARQ